MSAYSKRRSPAPPRDHTVPLKLSSSEFQLLDYAAATARARSTGTWMREQLIAAARSSLGDRVADSILEGSATVELMKASLAEAQKKRR